MSLNENKSVQGFALTLAQCRAHSVPGKTSTSGHTHVPSPPSASSNTNQGTQVGSPWEFRDCSVAMPSSKGQPRRCHGQLPGHRRETPSRKHQLTPTQLKAGAEQTPNCHKSTLSSAILKSIFPLACNQGHWCSGPALARDPNAEANNPQTLQSQPRNWVLFQLSHSGQNAHKPQRLQMLPRVKKNQPSHQNFVVWQVKLLFRAQSRWREDFLRIFFFLHSLLRGCEFAGAHQHLALHPCYSRNCCASPADHVPLLSKGSGSGRKYKTSR